MWTKLNLFQKRRVIPCQLVLFSALEEGQEAWVDKGVPEYIFLHGKRQRSSRRKRNNLPLFFKSLNFCINTCFETVSQNSLLDVVTSHSTSAESTTHF